MNIEWDLHEWTEFSDRLVDMARFESFCKSATEEITVILQKMLKTNTPVDYGNLRAGWDTYNLNYYAVRTATGFKVSLVNGVKYAVWVNDGHRQRPGRFIPGYWEGNHFRYDPNADGGMVLKQSWVKGRFFVEISLAQLAGGKQVEQIVYKQLQKWWKGCF